MATRALVPAYDSRPVQSSLTVLGETRRRPITVRVGHVIFWSCLSDGRCKTKASRVRVRPLQRFRCVAHETRQPCPVCDDIRRLCRHRAGAGIGERERPSGSALRQPQGRQGQHARRPGQDLRNQMALTSARACRSRSPPNSRTGGVSAMRRHRRLGVPLAAVGQAHGRGDRKKPDD